MENDALIGQQIGGYTIQSRLGEGGMARVYKAYQARLRRDVAIKVILSQIAEQSDFKVRFEREAQLIASLQHPNIVAVYAVGDWGNLTYLVMQYVGGGTLRDLLRLSVPYLGDLSAITLTDEQSQTRQTELAWANEPCGPCALSIPALEGLHEQLSEAIRRVLESGKVEYTAELPLGMPALPALAAPSAGDGAAPQPNTGLPSLLLLPLLARGPGLGALTFALRRARRRSRHAARAPAALAPALANTQISNVYQEFAAGRDQQAQTLLDAAYAAFEQQPNEWMPFRANVSAISLGENVLVATFRPGGGDHAIAIGTVAGVSGHFRKKNAKIGMIWIDAHPDMNTPETSPSGNIHGMPLAATLGFGNSALTNILDFAAKVRAEHCALVGTRDLDPGEKELIRSIGLRVFTMSEIDVRGMSAVIDEATAARDAGQEQVILFNLSGHGHFDMGAYDAYFAGKLQDYEYPAEAVAAAQERMPQVV